MAPTNRLIEARRSEIRAEEEAEKRRDSKTAPAATDPKRQTSPSRTRPKPKD